MQNEIAKADEEGDAYKRELAISDMMLDMTISAIELDKYETHRDTLKNISNMSPEEAAAFQKEQGVELDVELFKKYAPKAIEIAEKVNERYKKLLDKNSPEVSQKIVRNEIYIDQFGEVIKENQKKIDDVKNKVHDSERLSGPKVKEIDSKNRIKALLTANEVIENNKKGLDPKSISAENYQRSINDNNKEIDKIKKEIESNKELLKGRTSEEKDLDKATQPGYEYAVEETLGDEIANVLLSRGIEMRYRENKVLTTKKYQAELRKNAFKESALSNITDKETAQANIDAVNANKDFTAKEKEDLVEEIRKIEEEVTKAARIVESKILAQKEADELERKREEEAAANPGVNPDTDTTPVGDNLEDSDEDPDTESGFSDHVDGDTATKAQAGNNIALLDDIAGVNSEDFDEWRYNTNYKVGQKVTYTIELNYTGSDTRVKKALSAWISMGTNKVLTEELIKYLPIKASIGKNGASSSVHTYLPTQTDKNTLFDQNYSGERTEIIKTLIEGKEASSEITFTSGGGIIQDLGEEDGLVPEYILTERSAILLN